MFSDKKIKLDLNSVIWSATVTVEMYVVFVVFLRLTHRSVKTFRPLQSGLSANMYQGGSSANCSKGANGL